MQSSNPKCPLCLETRCVHLFWVVCTARTPLSLNAPQGSQLYIGTRYKIILDLLLWSYFSSTPLKHSNLTNHYLLNTY